METFAINLYLPYYKIATITAPQLNAIKIPNCNACVPTSGQIFEMVSARGGLVENGFPLRGRPRITIPEMNILSLTFARFHCSNCEHYRPAGAKPHSATINYAGRHASLHILCSTSNVLSNNTYTFAIKLRAIRARTIRIAYRVLHTSEYSAKKFFEELSQKNNCSHFVIVIIFR